MYVVTKGLPPLVPPHHVKITMATSEHIHCHLVALPRFFCPLFNKGIVYHLPQVTVAEYTEMDGIAIFHGKNHGHNPP